jgi:predicted Rossmann fold nucleotide-binding protein DprA/Smf involved in DNA uptake
MKIVIFGSRGIEDIGAVEKAMEACGMAANVTEIVSGGARGVDRLGERLCPAARPFLQGIPRAVGKIR